MFLRFGFAVGQVGMAGTLLIILIEYIGDTRRMVIAEIATNQKVKVAANIILFPGLSGWSFGSSIVLPLLF